MSAPMEMSRFLGRLYQIRGLSQLFRNIDTHQQTLLHCASCRCASSTGGGLSKDNPTPTPFVPSSTSLVGHAGTKKAEKISRAMQAYLERARAHDQFMSAELSEYEIGRRHLANIMGVDPDGFTQEDIERAVEYLLPSGLHDKKARPMMKHPDQVFPSRKAAQFGADGRPFHSMFYTGLPNYAQLMHDLAQKLEELKAFEDRTAAKGGTPDPRNKLLLNDSEWIEKLALETMLQEKLSDSHYEKFVTLFERVATHPYAHRLRELVMQYRRVLPQMAMLQQIPTLRYGENGRPYQEAEGSRKKAQARATVWGKGTGEVSINNQSMLDYFPMPLDRLQLAFPLHLTGKLGEVDIEAHVQGGGPSGQAGAVRLAVARALQSFVDRDMVEKMRLAGLLTKDPRVAERKKPGQKGARRKYTWKKR